MIKPVINTQSKEVIEFAKCELKGYENEICFKYNDLHNQVFIYSNNDAVFNKLQQNFKIEFATAPDILDSRWALFGNKNLIEEYL